jgi:hypothetical protein
MTPAPAVAFELRSADRPKHPTIPDNGGSMDRLKDLLKTHPKPASDAGDEALQCCYAAAECSLVCTACADACLEEQDVGHLRACIRLNQECSAVCDLAARVIARAGRQDKEILRQTLQLCGELCRACAEECGRHAATMEHCAVCADACEECAARCDEMVAALVP